MSEPTGDGNQQPDPGDDQEQGSVFSDPTAPVWAEPTTPIPATPAPVAPAPVPPAPVPPGPASPYGQQPEAPRAAPPAAEPVSNPYAQQPPQAPYGQQPPASPWQPSQPDPYGQPQPGQQYPAYSQQQPGYGQQYPAYGQEYYATGAPSTPSNTSAIFLTIVSGLFTVTTCVIGIPSLIFGIMALTSNSTDPIGSRKKAKTGWIIFAVNAGLIVLAAIAVGAIIIANSDSGPSNFNSGF